MHYIATVKQKAALSLYFMWIFNKTSASPVCSGFLDRENGSLRTGSGLYGVSQYLVFKKILTCLKNKSVIRVLALKKFTAQYFPLGIWLKRKAAPG